MDTFQAFEILLGVCYSENIQKCWTKREVKDFVNVCDFLMDEYHIDPEFFSEEVQEMIKEKRKGN